MVIIPVHRFRSLLLALALLCASIPSFVPALAHENAGIHAFSGTEPETAQGPMIRLATYTFDPLQGLPVLPQKLLYSDAEATVARTFIVQFVGSVLPEWKQAVVNAGGWLGDYVPDYAFLAYLSDDAVSKVQALPFVRWTGIYQPAYKMMAAESTGDRHSYRIMLAPWANAATVEAALAPWSANIRAFDRGFAADLNGDQLNQIAHLQDVTWIEPYSLQTLSNDVGGATIMGGSIAWVSGYTGSGMTVDIADTGLDKGSSSDIHLDFAGRVTHISSWPVLYADYGSGCVVADRGDDDGAADKSSGHGTHVSGSVAGDGARSSGQFKGLAYQASITFQAVEQWTTWHSPNSNCPNGYYLTGIPDDVRTLLAEAYGWGARVQNDSWGGGKVGVYDQQASYFDDFIHAHSDMVVVVAAGNNGIDSNGDGYVDENSIKSPGAAKNVLTIGASESERSSGGYNNGIPCSSWNTCWPGDYPANPTKDDALSNNREHMAAFSSRGPMADGRIKPDLVAPGTNIISVRSSQATQTGWGAYNLYYMYMGGTSMASPLAAGAATLVREYYVEREHVAAPSAALVKATLVNSAVDISGYGNVNQEAGKPIPNNHEGWGRIDVAAATSPGSRKFVDDGTGINTNSSRSYTYTITSSSQPLKATLVWSDYAGAPAASPTLVNDLDLRLTAPNGTVYRGNVFSGGWTQTGGSPDRKNNIENVYLQSPMTGKWRVDVNGYNVPQGPQPYALVVNGAILAVNSISPGSAFQNTVLHNAWVKGTSFSGAANVTLLHGLQVITGTGLSVAPSADSLTATFNLVGAATGLWDLRVTNNAGLSALLSGALLVGSASVYLPVVIQNGVAVPNTITLLSETFEGLFPGSWHVFDYDGTANGEYYWSQSSCRPYAGGYSGWAVGGGANGASLSCSANYPNNADSWLVYGPFSLQGATAADLSFNLWLSTELDYDGLYWGASINGTDFYLTGLTGNSNGWVDEILDLSNVYTLGNLMGQAQVWIAIIFTSDGSVTYPGGAFIDNITLRKCVAASCPASVMTSSSSANHAQTGTRTWQAYRNGD